MAAGHESALAGACRTPAPRGSNVERGRWTIDRLDVQAHHRVLEIGFGPGVALAELVRRASAGHVVGVDHSDTMVRQAQRRNARAIAQGRLELHLASVERLPRFAAPFDRVLAVNCIQFWEDAGGRLAELLALLRPDGGRIALTLQPRHAGATDADARRLGEEIAALLRAARFADVELALAAVRAGGRGVRHGQGAGRLRGVSTRRADGARLTPGASRCVTPDPRCWRSCSRRRQPMRRCTSGRIAPVRSS